ncbi:hypothetical protein QYM36_009827 [Artemia franciscana]|uniref:Uncharacterized protein n=1 Tax=Artemia franciscana TaxID=6661 RepID=A0AA88HSJ3_ARTSF|nr:hypothetical protein QYM36_009827 [Artemia franciscana]
MPTQGYQFVDDVPPRTTLSTVEKRNNNQSFSEVLEDGPKCNRPNMKPKELEVVKAKYTETFLIYDQAAFRQIYGKTKGQSSNEQWIYERSNKITSTFFHRIASQKELTKTGPIVRETSGVLAALIARLK